MPNLYTCSDGTKVSQSTIDRRRSQTYRELYEGESHPLCEGCNRLAQGSGHIIPQARAKHLGKTELCWSPENIFASCHSCNRIAENPSSDAIKSLLNFSRILEVSRKYDNERYLKMML